MEQIPDIVMQCPKCGKKFSLDASYCEACTAMLEPVEIPQGPEQKDALTAPVLPDDAGAHISDKLDDAGLAALKTETEESFVFTLLFELALLKERIRKREAALSDLQTRREDAGNAEFLRTTGKAESAISSLLARTAKIESTLDSLRRSFETDIATLEKELEESGPPKPLGRIAGSGKYSRMRLSELNAKKRLLTSVTEKTALKRPVERTYVFLALIAFVLIAGAALLFFGVMPRKSSDTAPPLSLPSSPQISQKSEEAAAVQVQDIYDLLEDIKNANTKKDLGLWQSRYASRYLAQRGRRDDIAAQWKKFNYVSLQYRIEDIRMLPEKATAVVGWDMELKSLDSGRSDRISQKLHCEFIVEDGRLKIASVRKIGQ